MSFESSMYFESAYGHVWLESTNQIRYTWLEGRKFKTLTF